MANQKRITELPIINALSGSANGASIIPVVVGGTTNQIIVERFSEFVNAYNATTSSNTFIGNQTISGSLVVTNDIRAERYYIETISSSVIYESGSTQFGDSIDDTHTFTGSLLVTGSVILNGSAIGIGQLNEQTASQDLVNLQISSTTGSINTTTASFDLVFLQISSTTGSINTTTASFDEVFLQISSTTGSINVTTASFDEVFFGISSVTGAMNTQSSSQDLVNLQISSTTGSINVTTSSFDSVFLGISSVTGAMNTQSSSQDLVNLQISSTTGSINTTTASFDEVFFGISSVTGAMNTTTSSFDSVFFGISSVTGSINTTTSSFDSVFFGISSVTGAMNTQSSSQDLVNLQISSTTGSINTTTSSFDNVFFGISVVTSSIDNHILGVSEQTSSQNGVNLDISIVTGSLIGITNTLMAFTASLDDTYATDEQLYQLYQATSSIHITTSSLNTQTGSQDLVNLDISTFTGSQNIINTSVDAHILDISTQTGSQDLVNLDISTFTGSQNVINTSVDNHILGISTQTGSQDLVNLGISTFTGSLRDEVNLIEAYTASLKGAIEISGQDVNVLGMITAQQFNVTLVSSSVMYQSGSTQFGDTSDDIHTFTGTINLNGLTLGTSELMAQTSSQNNVNFGISVITSSIDEHILGVSTQTGSQDLVNLGISTFTGSLRDEVNGIEAYTSSLKAQPIVSSSTQIENYNLFAVTSSENTFYGNQSITGSLFVSDTMVVDGDILPTTTEIYDLGSPDLRWRDLYLSGSTIDLGGLLIQRNSDGNVQFIDSASQETKSVTIDSITGSLDISGNVTASNITATNIAGTLSTAAQTNITSVGTLSSLAVSGTTTATGNLIFDTDDRGIQSNTSDAADNKFVFICGGGARGSDRGAGINLFGNESGGTGRLDIIAGNVTGGVINLQTEGINRVTVLKNGNVEVKQNLVFPNGKGIDFSATAGEGATSSLLDDYEEGTWSPVYEPTSGSFATMTMDIVTAKYTKIGNMVTVYAQIRTDNVDVTGGSGSVRIGGLPFTISGEGGGIAIGFVSNFTNAPDGGVFVNATTQITLTKSSASTNLLVADLSDGVNADHNYLYFTGTYMA